MVGGMGRTLAVIGLPFAVLAAGALLVGLAVLNGAGQDPLFSEAEAYERFMGRWSRALAPLLVQFAGVRDADAVLDVGAGTGALTAAVSAVAPTSTIVGIDPAAPYVALAKSRMGNARISFEGGDAQQMSFPDRRFDRTLSLLVVNFIPDSLKATREMRRVTRSGGTVAAAVWDYGEGMEMLRVFWDEVTALRPAGTSVGGARHRAIGAQPER